MEAVASAPAAVEDGFGKAKEAVDSTGELLESIPRTVQEIPIEVSVLCVCAPVGIFSVSQCAVCVCPRRHVLGVQTV